MEHFTEALGWYVVFLFSTTLHEAAHAWAAQKGGDLTAYHGGQVSLDPLPHIKREPLGMVVLPLLFSLMLGWPFGFASAPYDPVWARNYPRRAALMALAGPAANFLLVIFAALIIRVGLLSGGFVPPDFLSLTEITVGAEEGFWASGALLVSMIFSLNLILGIFNLLPIPPYEWCGNEEATAPSLMPRSLRAVKYCPRRMVDLPLQPLRVCSSPAREFARGRC